MSKRTPTIADIRAHGRRLAEDADGRARRAHRSARFTTADSNTSSDTTGNTQGARS